MILIPIIISIIIIFFFYRKTVPQLFGWQKYLLISLRSIALITLLILLINPILYYTKPKIEKPKIIVLNDVSESMQQKVEETTKSDYFEKAKSTILANAKNYQILEFDFADGLEGSKESTNLTKTLDELSRKINLDNVKSMFLYSDGWFSDKNLNKIEKLNIPIYTFDPQIDSNDFDISIAELKYNKTAYQKEPTPINVSLQAQNYSGSAVVRLSFEDKVIDSKTVDFKNSNFEQIDFELDFKQTGLHIFNVFIQPEEENEINKNNNKRVGAIQVKSNRTKILIISEKLNWDAKFIIDTIKQNPRWEHLFLLKNNYLFDGRKRIELTEIDNVAIIILINNGNLRLNNSERLFIERFNKNKGNLILFGKPIAALADISPAIESKISNSFNAVFQLNKSSERYNSFSIFANNAMEDVPPVDYYYVREKIQSLVLGVMDNEEKSPAILLDSAESILQFTFTGFYKWQLWDADNNYNNFIHNIISWLEQKTTDRFVSFTDKNLYFSSEPVEITLQAFDEKLAPILDLNAKLTITGNNEKLEKFLIWQDDSYKARINSLSPGKYGYQISADKLALRTSGQFVISSQNAEDYDRNFNILLLKYIAKQSRGKVITANQIDEFELPSATNIVEKIVNEIPIYKKWYIITLFLLSFCLELFFRKRWGLL